MSVPHYVVRGDLHADGRALHTEDGRVVAEVDSMKLAGFLAEAHNAYVPALRALLNVLHPDAIPESWEGDDRGPVSILEVANLLAYLLPENAVGAPVGVSS